jgi:uncharacterized protein YcfJ
MQLASPALIVQFGGYLSGVSHALTSPRDLIALAAVVLAGLAVAFLARAGRVASAVTAGPLRGRVRALREKARSAVFQRQLNPDADGHRRPRAPSAAPAAA